MSIHRGPKKQDTQLLSISLPNIDRFSKNSFTGTLIGKFAIKTSSFYLKEIELRAKNQLFVFVEHVLITKYI